MILQKLMIVASIASILGFLTLFLIYRKQITRWLGKVYKNIVSSILFKRGITMGSFYVCYKKGSEGKFDGYYALRENRGDLPCFWFLHNSTVVIGAKRDNSPLLKCKDCKTPFQKSICPYYMNPKHYSIPGMWGWGSKRDLEIGGSATYYFQIPQSVLNDAEKVLLKISCKRIEGRLHSLVPDKYARIFVNSKLVSEIRFPIGMELEGFHCSDGKQPRPIDIIEQLVKNEIQQKVKLEVDPEVMWDVDEVRLEFERSKV